MHPIRLQCICPTEVDDSVRFLLGTLALSEAEANWLPYESPSEFQPEPSECHINAAIQLNFAGGSVVSGWAIWQDKAAGFVEAEFHTVWRAPSGALQDVTPRRKGQPHVLFFPDTSRALTLTEQNGLPAVVTYDNVRIQNGEVCTGISRHVRVLQTELIYTHGLASRDAKPSYRPKEGL